MIQFNLLPDVKLEYIKTERTKRTVIGFSVLASAIALALLVFLVLTVDVAQRAYINGLSNEISKKSSELRSTPNLSKMLTVQNQMNTLDQKHKEKLATSRTFDFFNQITPTDVSISQLTLDTVAKTVVVTGSAPTNEAVNAFVDAMKYTTYKTSNGTTSGDRAFRDVVLTLNRSDQNATFTVNATVDTAIFDNTQNVTLTVSNNAAATAASVIFQR